ncbi:MAG: TetR/AcrR family transcriptional regulator [Lachnospiraceae bacterium]|nr:TetR/AcrR family transcriptional regulator [Lachnospiraceae bacterium]
MEDEDVVRKRIIEETKNRFIECGTDFSVDTIAKNTKTSKKTIYRIFGNKNMLLVEMVDSIFESIFERVDQVFEDESLEAVDILRELLFIISESFWGYNIRAMLELKETKDSGEAVIREMDMMLDSLWNRVGKVVDFGVSEGDLRNVSVENIRFIVESIMISLTDKIKSRSIKREELETIIDELVCILTDGVRNIF